MAALLREYREREDQQRRADEFLSSLGSRPAPLDRVSVHLSAQERQAAEEVIALVERPPSSVTPAQKLSRPSGWFSTTMAYILLIIVVALWLAALYFLREDICDPRRNIGCA